MATRTALAANTVRFSPEDLNDLRWSYQRLEHPSFAARLSNYIGTPIEKGLKLLPKRWYELLDRSLDTSIQQILSLAIASMDTVPPNSASQRFHKALAVGSGAVGGFFGPITLLVELPVTTTIILRSIADIAHEQGEDLKTTEARLACAQVFSLGGRTREDMATDAGYYGIRTMLSLHFSSSLIHLNQGKPMLPSGVEFFRAILARFGVVIGDKAAAQLVPVVGAVCGALINLIFIQHFQDIARGHFTVRRLERKYGAEMIKRAYQKISKEEVQAMRSYSTVEGW
jgi:hypothetical protein